MTKSFEKVHPDDALGLTNFMCPSNASTVPDKHSVLGVSAYSQVTSPIRRVADLLTHWQLKDKFRKKSELISPDELNHILPDVSEKERLVKRLQRMNQTHWSKIYMLDEAEAGVNQKNGRRLFQAYHYGGNEILNYLFMPEVGVGLVIPKRELGENARVGDWITVQPYIDEKRLSTTGGIAGAVRIRKV